MALRKTLRYLDIHFRLVSFCAKNSFESGLSQFRKLFLDERFISNEGSRDLWRPIVKDISDVYSAELDIKRTRYALT